MKVKASHGLTDLFSHTETHQQAVQGLTDKVSHAVHSAIVLANGLVKLHTTALARLELVRAKEAQDADPIIALHPHLAANFALQMWKLGPVAR